ncbi:MAG: glycoside hydrolase family 25 protein [Actinomycetota bacterium]
MSAFLALTASAMLLGAVPAHAAGTAGADGSAGAAHTAGATPDPPPPNSLPGIDVSHYQNLIDWTQVAPSGIQFAFAKATEGTGYIDPMYATNRAGAAANGIAFGAYHFARPDLHPSGAITEADHFVDTAQILPGDLRPVLDVERSGSLTQEAMTSWILEWLGEVTARTGVMPMIYTSPIGWSNRTGDTTAIADAGYTMLWVAHWNVDAPTVPGNDWAANGWTFWQYSDCGHVPGIMGCVDSDWFNGLDLQPATIPSPDTTAPVASVAVPTGVQGPITLSFSEIVQGVTSDNVALRTADTATTVPGSLTCWSQTGKQADCVTGKPVTAVIEPLDVLVPGESYAVVVNPVGVVPQVVDRSANPATPVEQGFAPPIEVEENSPAVRYTWRKVSAPTAYGRSYMVQNTAGATASYAFTGASVTWFTVTGPTQGQASVWIDGHLKGIFNGYAPSVALRAARAFHGLAPGGHTITVRVLGKKGSTAGTDTQVAIDAFEAGGHNVWTPPLVASWGRHRVGGASGGSVAMSDLTRSDATLAFFGSGVEWHTVRGPDQGRAQIYVDGVLMKTVDGYGASTTTVLRSITGLASGLHKLRIVVLGEGRPAASDANVAIDAFTVLP